MSYAHIAQLMTYNYVTKHFGILQRIIKSQSVIILCIFEHSKSRYLSSQRNLWLNFRTVFQVFNFFFNFRPYQCAVLKKKIHFFFFHMRKCPHTWNCTHGNFLKIFQVALLPNINLLSIKKTRHQNLSPKYWSSGMVLLVLDMYCLLHKQTGLYNQT